MDGMNNTRLVLQPIVDEASIDAITLRACLFYNNRCCRFYSVLAQVPIECLDRARAKAEQLAKSPATHAPGYLYGLPIIIKDTQKVGRTQHPRVSALGCCDLHSALDDMYIDPSPVIACMCVCVSRSRACASRMAARWSTRLPTAPTRW